MNDEDLAQSIAALERALAIEDPAWARRVRQMERRDALHALLVGALLAIGAVLLTVGLATTAPAAWSGGIGAFAVAVVLDFVYQRRRRRAG